MTDAVMDTNGAAPVGAVAPTPDDARRRLLAAARLRLPKFGPRDTEGQKIQALEGHLLNIAIMRGELEESRLYMQMALFNLQTEWDKIEGWEVHLPAGAKARTKEAILQAKRLVGSDEEDLYQGIREATFLIARLTEQINRLSHMGDDQVASRVYTLLAGS